MKFPNLRRYDRLGIDTETTGVTYNDQPVGCSIWLPDETGYYFAWGHKDGGNNCTLVEFIRWARVELCRPDLLLVFLNPLFDMRMLEAVGVPVHKARCEGADTVCSLLNEYEPGYSLGDLSQKYVPEIAKDDQYLNEYCAERYGGSATRKAQAANYWKAPGSVVSDYAIDDARATLGIYDVRRPLIDEGAAETDLTQIYRTETDLLPVLLKMYQAGVKIDKVEAERVQAILHSRYKIAELEWNEISGGFKFSERTRMLALFTQLGIEVPRNEPTRAMALRGITVGNPRMDKYFLDELDHPVGALIRQMRQLTHYADTFIQGYLLDNLQPGDLIHPNFYPTRSDFGGTITGRFSSSGGLNAQNIPARDEEWAPLIRGMFIPYSDDHLWLKSDFSQIEYRFFAHFAGGQMRQAYVNNPEQDFHQFVMDLTGLKRKPAKNVNFAKLYGAGVPKMAKTIGCTEEEAEKIAKVYDTKIPEAKKLITKAMNRASVRGQIRTWGGRTLRFKRRGQGYEKTFTALNKLLQGSSANLTKMAMIRVGNAIDWENTIMHLTVHDELDFSVMKGTAGIIEGRRIKAMMEDYKLTVPIIAEAELGPDWGHCEPLPEEG